MGGYVVALLLTGPSLYCLRGYPPRCPSVVAQFVVVVVFRLEIRFRDGSVFIVLRRHRPADVLHIQNALSSFPVGGEEEATPKGPHVDQDRWL